MSTPHDVHFDDTLAATRGRSNYYFSFATWHIGVGSPRYQLSNFEHDRRCGIECVHVRRCILSTNHVLSFPTVRVMIAPARSSISQNHEPWFAERKARANWNFSILFLKRDKDIWLFILNNNVNIFHIIYDIWQNLINKREIERL